MTTRVLKEFDFVPSGMDQTNVLLIILSKKTSNSNKVLHTGSDNTGFECNDHAGHSKIVERWHSGQYFGLTITRSVDQFRLRALIYKLSSTYVEI